MSQRPRINHERQRQDQSQPPFRVVAAKPIYEPSAYACGGDRNDNVQPLAGFRAMSMAQHDRGQRLINVLGPSAASAATANSKLLTTAHARTRQQRRSSGKRNTTATYSFTRMASASQTPARPRCQSFQYSSKSSSTKKFIWPSAIVLQVLCNEKIRSATSASPQTPDSARNNLRSNSMENSRHAKWSTYQKRYA